MKLKYNKPILLLVGLDSSSVYCQPSLGHNYGQAPGDNDDEDIDRNSSSSSSTPHASASFVEGNNIIGSGNNSPWIY